MAPAVAFASWPRLVATTGVIGSGTVPLANLGDTTTGTVAINPSATLGFALDALTTTQTEDPQDIENPASTQAGDNAGSPSVIPLGKVSEN